jgi:hypothetical protein
MAKTTRVDNPHREVGMGAKEPNPTLDALGITAIAKSQKPDKQRNLLTPGFYDVNLRVGGMVDGHTWHREIVGTLTVAPDAAPTATSSTPWEELLQVALCEMTAKDRQAFLAKVAMGQVPEADCGAEKAAAVAAELEPALTSYRAAHPAAKRGTVSFVPTTPKA